MDLNIEELKHNMANMSDEDYDVGSEKSEDLSYSDLDSFPDFLLERAESLNTLQLDHNQITAVPRGIARFTTLKFLDISNNGMTYLSNEIIQLRHLHTLQARNNHFTNEDLPKDLGVMHSLRIVNFGGNNLREFPMQLTEISGLTNIGLGGNRIQELPNEISRLVRLVIFFY